MITLSTEFTKLCCLVTATEQLQRYQKLS